MKLREARGETSQREIAKVMRKHGIPLTDAEISKAEKGYIYLSPKAEDIACEYLKAPYLYTRDELQYRAFKATTANARDKPSVDTGKAVKASTATCKRPRVHNFHFRMPKERIKAVPKDLYQVLGFRTGNAWFEHVHHQAIHEYQEIKKAAPEGD